MTKNRQLRTICIFGFLLLMAPFYDACNGRGMKNVEASAEEVVDSTYVAEQVIEVNDTITNTEVQPIEIVEYKPTFLEKVYDAVDDERTLNGFEFAYCSLDFYLEIFKSDFQTNLKEFKEIKFKDFVGTLTLNLFLLIAIISLLMVVLSFSKKTKLLQKLALTNFIFIIITLLYILFFDELFETISQIKWGYYSFILVQFGIFWVVKRLKPL